MSEAEALIAGLEAQEAHSWHVPDQVRVGVLAGLEEYETWLQAHLMRCAACRGAIIDLLGQAQGSEVFSDEGEVACAEARNAVMHFLETGRPPALPPFQHIATCEACSQTFYEPAKAASVLEFDPEDVGEAG
ncbi:MAG TPA: hypothetical protein VFT91_08035 [Dehalococcoidia bacterium]|nr:hypothetical protein [Dehalococcoidia bacterium]